MNQNRSQIHGLPMLTNWSSNALLRMEQPNTTTTILHQNQPLKRTLTELNNIEQTQGKFLFFFLCLIAFSLIPASTIVFIVKEKESGSKQQQQISGVSMVSQWLCNFFWDTSKWLLCVLVFQVAFWVGGVDFLLGTSHQQLQVGIAAMVAYGQFAFPLIYFLSQFFNNLMSAMVSVLSYLQVQTIIGWMGQLILSALNKSTDSDGNLIISNSTVQTFDIILGLTNPVQDLIRVLEQLELTSKSMNNKFQSDPFEFITTTHAKNGLDQAFTKQIVQSLVSGSVLLIMLALMELEGYQSISWDETTTNSVSNQQEKSACVLNLERDVMNLQHKQSQSVVVRNLLKNQGSQTAVSSISFMAGWDECVVVFGTNGAGKTTMFKCLSGEIQPSGGSVWIAGIDNMQKNQITRQLIGYCPQANSLIDLLDCREHLQLQARLKLIPSEDIEKTVDTLISMMRLKSFEHTQAVQLSGGNKRKLMTAISLIGFPRTILLDEPSTGVDPEAKRFMWNSIRKFKSNSSVVISTNSMEEAEALADRILLMKDGHFIFQGTLHDLKQHQSAGIQINLILSVKFKDVLDLQQVIFNTAESSLSRTQIKELTTQQFEGNLTWDDLASFGNGVIIEEILSSGSPDETHVDVFLQVEFILIVKYTIVILKVLTSAAEQGVKVESTGKMLKLNLLPGVGGWSMGTVYQVLQKRKEELKIQTYSMSATRLDEIYKKLINYEEKGNDNSHLVKKILEKQ